MRLRDLLPTVDAVVADFEVTQLSVDSRQVAVGGVFVALTGAHDSAHFIPNAIAAGAAMILQEVSTAAAPYQQQGVWFVPITGLSAALGAISARWYGHPSAGMRVFAVTGTNGKTSVANLIAGAAGYLQHRTAVIGTLGNGFPGELQASRFTTPDPLQLQGLLADFKAQGAQWIAMEASSHGLEQGRMSGTDIDTAIFTNLTRDHLDYHGDMASYGQAKAKLFAWPKLRVAVLNIDDPSVGLMSAALADDVKRVTYSVNPSSDADVVAELISPSLDGLVLTLRYRLRRYTLRSQLIGRFNASNLLAVFAALVSAGENADDVMAALAQTPAVRGRMQCVRQPGAPLAVIDYAHTPDALAQALKATREHTPESLWCVFGCGGGRDQGKRIDMAQFAGTLADQVIITTDNPRDEDPQQIIQDLVNAMPAGSRFQVIADRGEAIAQVMHSAGLHDVVLVAGKGHEDYQEVKGVRTPFSDYEHVRMASLLRGES